jgi:hypothetical protein
MLRVVSKRSLDLKLILPDQPAGELVSRATTNLTITSMCRRYGRRHDALCHRFSKTLDLARRNQLIVRAMDPVC